MVGDGEAEVGEGDEDGGPVLGHQQPHQPRLGSKGGGWVRYVYFYLR